MMLSPDGEMHCLNTTVKGSVPPKTSQGNFSVMNDVKAMISFGQAPHLQLSFEGYWTDNGAYYYYQTMGPNITYEDTLIELNEEFQKMKLPMKYM